MESSDEETLSERSYVSERSERSLRSERSGGSLSPCPSGLQGPSGDTLPWNRPSRHERGERRKRKTHNSVLDPAERAVVRVADERDRVQKKTFMKWVNKHLIKVRKHITDLYEDLRDGHNLISLLEVLSGVTLPREKGRMRFHRLQNVQIALDFLKQRQVKLVNIRNDDITDGNPKLTLGLIWTIILHFQISEIYVSGESGDLTAKEKLLLWSQQASEGWPGLRCTNFSSSWSDGRMFNALLHRFRPDLIDMEVVAQQSNLDNLEQAFEIAESLGVTRLLDAEDVDVPSPDEKSVITYVSSIYDAFPKIPEGGEGIAAHEVDHRWAEYRSRFSTLLQWSRQHKAIMANKNFPLDPVELKALYNEYVHFKETEIPAKELEKSRVEHLYKLLEVWMEFGRIKLPLGLHPNDLEEEWGKLILEMLEREKALRPAVERLELLLQMANKIQNMALDCEEKLTLAKNTLQADMSLVESGEAVCCERELGLYLQDCEVLIRQLNLDLNILRDEKYYQVEQLAFRSVEGGGGELVSLRLQCSSVYRKGHFSPVTGGDRTAPRGSDSGLSLSTGAQTLLGAVGVVGVMGAALLRRPMSRSQLVAMSSSEDEGSLRFVYELLGWVEETQDVLERAEWGADLPSVEQNLQDHQNIHTAVEELLHSLKEARNYQTKVSPNFKSSYSDTLAKLEHLYCKLLELSSWRLRCLESLHAFVCRCTEELIWLNEREEEELAYDWSQNNTNVNTKRELYAEMRSELEEKQEVMHSLQETADRLCQENHPAKQTVEAYSAALQTQWQWVRQLCVCVEQHLKDNTTYFQFVSDARDCETYLRQLQDTIKRQYTCDKNSRLGKLEDLLQDSMEEKEQLIEYRSSVASLVGRAKTVVQLRPRSAESTLGSTTPIRAICDYRQIEITISRGEECVLGDNSQRTKWKVISPSGNEAMVPSVCFTVPPPNQEAMDTASRMEQLYQNVMSLWHNLHVSMKSVVSWHYLQKDIRTVSSWSLDTVRSQPPVARDQALDHLEAHLADFLSDSKESALFTPTERHELERDAHTAQEHCQDLLVNMETVEKDESVSRSYLSELQNIKLRLEEAEQRLMRGIQTPPPSNRSGDGVDNTVQIAEQEKLQSDLDGLRTSLGEVSRRCGSFFEEKPASSSVPVLRSELNLAVEKIDRLHNLSSVYLHKLKTVDVLMYSLQAAESQVKRYENRLSEEDIVPVDTNAIQALREQLGTWQSELEDQEGVFNSLQSAVQKAREAGSQLNRLHPDRSPELERYQERAAQLTERWAGVKRQMETRRGELEALGSVLQQYRDGHSALIHWIEETTERQENTQPGQTDSKVLSEQLAQQTALVADIEKNQTKLDECQTHSKQYCTSVKDYELQLMTFRAFVESTQKSTGKRRRMHSSSDTITQEFMDLRTRYTALVTLTTQHVKYISDALRRLEEEEVLYVSLFVSFSFSLLVSSTFLCVGQIYCLYRQSVSIIKRLSSRLSPEERAQVTSQMDELTATYSQLCDSSTAQLQQLVQQQSQSAIGGVIDLGTMETVPVFQAARRGLIDLDTCHVLLEAQLTMGGLFQPDSPVSLSLEEGLNCGLIDSHISQSLSELESALHLVDQTEQLEGQLLPVAAAMEAGLIKEEVGLRILELQINTGGLRELGEGRLTLNSAGEMGLLTPRVYTKLGSRVNRRELIDPNTADKLNLDELQQRCILSDDTGLYLLPVKQHPGGTVCLRSGRKVGIFRAVQEGLIDRQVTVRLLEAQLFAGGISDPRSGHLLTVNEAVHHNLMDQDLACAMLTRQLQSGGILDPVTGDRLGVEEAIQTDLLSPHLALLVLESLWAFMGMLWPESGELLPIAEALQQGVISGELALNILRQRHAIGALYLPETPKVVSLNQAKEVLEPKVAEILKEIQIPDVLHNMNQSGLNCDPSFLEKMAPEEQAHHRLLFHLMTHSYVDAHSGQRLVLLEPELVELAKAAAGLINVDPIPGVVEEGMSLTTERQECMEVVPDVSLPDTLQTREIGKVQEKSAIFSLPEKCIYSRKMGEEADNQGWDGTPDTLQANQTGIKEMGQVDLDSTMRISEEVDGGVHREVKGEKDEMVSFESAPPSAGLPEKQLITDSYEDGLVEMESEGARESGHRKAKEKDSLVEDVDSTLVEALEMYSTPVKPETLMPTQYFKEPDISPSETNEKEGVPVSVGVKYAMKDTQRVTEKTQPHVMRLEAAAVKSEEDVELERLASELQQGGLLTEGGQRLLPDEAVAQGVLPGHTAVKLMAKAGLFGGFLDVSACESLSMEDVMQEGLLDEDLMWSVLKSEKTLAGVVDVEKGKICTLKDAARAGLIDSNTAARLLEAQVVSGGVVDLRRDKKVSVTLAANLGLIEEDQREKLFTLEKSYRGKGSDPDASLTKATLQLQMNGVVDPKTKSPVPLKQALERGLLGQEEVYQALSQQVAEGGIVHHYSGVRLSVTDALQRGLVDCAISPKLWELERACQGEVALSSNPDAALLQASTGAILDPDLKCRLTLTEAVSDGLLNESIAKKAMVSPGITEGILDPESAQIVPYADLVNQGKIDIKSGKRFLEVKPFKGIQDKQTGEILNLAKAIASQQVDPVPALRMLQSQADTGGIIDISNGARLPLPKASKKGLVGEHMARLIATNQVLKGGLLDPSTGQRVSSLKKAVKDELISREMAAELQDNLGSMEVERDDEDSSTPVASSSGTYSPADTLSISSPDSQTRQPNQTKPIIIESSEVISPTPHPEESEKRYNILMIAEDIAKTLEAATFRQSGAMQHHGSVYIEEEMEEEQVSIAGNSSEIEGDGVAETIRSVEEFLAEHGDSLSPEERANLQGALSRMKEQYSALTDTAQSSLVQLDTAISTTVQQNTQRVRLSTICLICIFMDTAELQQLQAQQAQLMQVSQNARSLLDQPDSAVPAEEKRRLRDQLDQLQTQHQEKLRSCQERLRRSEALKDELAKFLQEHGGLGTWLEQSEGELCSLGEGETDLAEDVICHKADLRFVSISGQKVLDSVQGALEKVGGSDPALEETKQLVTDKLQDANHRYIALHTKVVTTPTLSPLPLPISEPDGLEKRFSSLSESMSERAEQLQTSVAQSVSVQEGLKGLLAWLDGLLLTPGPIQPTAQAVQDLLSRQGSVEATCDSVSKLLQSSDASTASGLQGSLESLTQSYAAAQAKQAEREAELRGLLPKLENYERLSTDLQGFTQTCLRALSPAGQPDRSVEDYRQTIEVRGWMIDISSCEQQSGQFRSLSGSLLRWLQATQEQNYVRPLITFKHFFTKDLLSDWEAQGVRVLELNKTGSELETLIINITAPQTKTGKGNGETTVYEASLELRQKARQSTEELSRWLGDRENSLHLGQTAASPSKPEVVRAQAQENKALLSELAEHSGKVKELKSTLEKLIADNPDSPEADTWRQQMKEIDSRWEKANEAAVQRQVELETCADRLGSFATAASQLGPWLKEKELMMSVLGPLSIDPNMLNTQNQQVQFMLREFDTRRPQFDQLTQAAEGILSPSGGDSSPQDAKDLAEVRSELGSISQQWDDLTQRLSRRSEHIDQAQGTSERYQALLKNLSVNVGALGERLDSQASLSAQPEALKRRLQETGEIRSELEQRREELGEAEKLCGELSAIVVEPYLRDELKKRLESVSSPLRSLEERAADGLSQLQAALSSTQQFQQMFEELRSWLDNQSGQRDSTADSLPCQSEAIRTLLAQQDELHRGVASQRGPYELIQAEGASLLASLPAGGEERSALLSRLTDLRRDWDELNQCITERQNRLKSTLTKAESYQQHRAELTPWVAECEEREADIQLSLDPAALDEALQKARQLGLDLERRRPLLEALNIAADQLLEHCRVGEEDVRDEKAQLNRRVDGLAENLQNRVSQLEELAGRLKEFEDGRQAVERRLEAARHQIEVQDALGPQACSNKSLERLRSQQETLHSLQPQVAYLRDLAQGLVQDAPHTAGGGGEGGQRLEQQARDTDREFGDVSEKVRRCCCSTLETRLQGVGEVQSSVRDLFSHLADLDDELDSLSPVGRDADSLASQADAVHAFLARLATLRSELEGHGGDCTAMLRREGSSPDLLALRRETEALSRQAGKLSERGQARMGQIEVAAEKVGEFYAKVAELQGLLRRAEEGLNAQGVVGTEVETIKQQLHEFKAVEREQVDSIQPKLQRVNAVGQGLIQSAAKHTDTQALEHDLETTNLRWNSLNKRVAERIAQLQEALLHCGKFQDALEPLLSWLSDTEELVANQKPPSAEYRVVKAQIQEQKLLQRLLDDRRATFQMIQGEGERIAATAETQDRDKIQKQLESLGERWGELLEKARARQCQLEELQTLALQFHEAVEPLGEWLSATERRLSTAEPMGTQTSKITQQITKHKSLNEEIVSRKKQVDQAIKNGQALLKQTTGEEVLLIQEKLDGIKSRYAEMTGGSSKALRTLEQALQLSTRFASAHDDLNQWLDKVEAELNVMEPDATPAYQDRQKELKCVSAEKRLVLDTVNEVGNALLDLVPWRAREGLDRLVADANQRYRTAAETITQRVKLVQAAIQRSQQYEEAVDAELTWAGETDRKLSSLGPLSLEPDVTVAQLQVQRAFNIDIIRHKDTVDQLLHTRDDILETCSDQQRDALVEKTDSLSARYEAVSQQHQERFSALEQAQVLVARFWETQEDLEPWLGETETLIAQLPPPAIDTEALRLQQEQMRLLRESIAEHKPHIDKLLKIGPQLAALSHQEGATVRKRYSDAEKRYVAIKEVVKGRATTLDEAVSQSAQFHDKMDPLLETLEGAVQRLRSPPPVAAEADKIREQLADHKATGLELDKLLPSFSALCARGEELISRAAHDDPAAQGGCLKRTKIERPYCRAEEREGKLTDVLDLAGKFWADMAALLSTLRDSQDIVRELEDPGVDPSLIKQQIEAAEAIKAETDGLREELEFVRTLGADLIFACGETEKPEVKKTIDEMNAAWEGLNRTWRERMERLEEAMTASVQYQDALQSMFDYLDNAVIKLCDMSTVGTDLGTVKQQIEELKQYKVEVYQQQIDMEKLCHQGELLLKKVSDQTDRDMIQEPITELRHLWDNLGDKITHRQHKLEGALLALGQFQHALSELQSWLSHTHATLDTQRPINSDPKAIEIELAKHHVLRNDVLSHRSTVETVNTAGAELLESSPGDEANHLRDQLDHLNRGWENLLLKTQDRQKLLEAALHQAEGFHGELEEFLQWLRRTESQLSAAKPTGGLPETAREQLQQHLELQTQLAQRAEQYNRLLDAGESMLLSRGGEEGGPGAGTTQTQQNLTLLQSKWASLNTKMDDRRAKLDEAVSLATGFQSSLQDTINWLTQAEQTLNMAQPPSLILDTVLFQIDEHKVFVNEVNTHREQVLALEKAGSQLRFASIKQDVVLIKNLLLSVQARWDKLVQRSLDRGRHLDEARKRAKQFHEAWRKLSDWLEEAESRLDSELEISNEPDKIKVQLTKHKEFQKALGSKQPVYDTTVRSGKAMRDKAMLPEDTQKLDHLLGEVRDKWDTVCGKSVERQHKLEEALLFSGQFAEALQALVDWLYRVEPQLAEDLPVHGDLDLVSNLMDSHKAFQKELGKRTTSVHALKRSARELMETGRDDTAWVKVQLQELSNRWDTVCALSVTKQTRLQQALKQAEEFRTAVQLLLEWLSEAEQTLRFRGVLPEEAETLQALLHTHRNFMATVEEKRTDVNRAAGQGEAILTACQADCITTIKHWITIIRARFEEVLTWAKQHEQRLETALTELLNNATLLEELLSWLQWAETTLVQRDGETLPQDIPQLKTLITEHQVFMEEMTRKQPDVDKVTKTYKRKPAEPPSSLHQQAAMQVAGGNPRLTQLCSRWQQVWLLALDRQRKLNDALDRLEELKEFASFDFDVWRKKYMRWMNHKKSRVMDFFRRIDKDQDGKITRQEFIDGILASKFPTSRLEMTAVADIFDQDGDGYIDYYEFVAALHPNKDAYRPTTDADKIEDEVTRQVAQCKCAKRFQVEQIGENKYRFFLGNQFGDSQQLRLVRILRSTVMVRVGGGWMALDEFLVKNDPCRARGRTNLELREKFILPEGASQGLAAFRSRGRRSKPGSRTASPTRSSSSASHSAHSCASLPSTPATPTASSRGAVSGSKLKRPTFHSSRGSLTGENGGATPTSTKPGRTGKAKVLIFHSTSGAASRAGSRAGSRASSRRGSDASDASELLETRSACSDTSDTPRRPGAAKPSKIPTISKKAPSPKTPTSGKK
uniref:Microtubule actin crosslinking factor 1 n=1 Tax=Salmo trutta TaxID=8032 RepID=A0A674F496_SALTR